MATTEKRLRADVDLEELWRASSDVDEEKKRPARDVTAKSSVDPRKWSQSLLILWVAFMASIFLLEPAPANADAVVPVWGQLLGLGFSASFVGAVSGLALRSPWGTKASALAGGFGMVIAGACAATGHHAGTWWVYELVGFSALAGGSVLAPRGTGLS